MDNLPTRGASQEQRQFLASKLCARFKELDLSQSEVARRLGTGRYNVSGWVGGKLFPRPAMLRKLAKVLDCEVAYLVSADLAKPAAGENPAFQMVYNHGGTCSVRLNMTLPADAAMAIMDIVRQHTA